MAKKRDLRVVWDCYRVGDHISDAELDALITDTEQALKALRYRKDFGIAVRVLAQDLASLEGYRNTRRGFARGAAIALVNRGVSKPAS
jgi:hypothetical protein